MNLTEKEEIVKSECETAEVWKQSSRGFCKKGVLENFAKFTGKHLCQSPFFNKVAGLRPATFKKETLVQVFSYEFCEIFKNTFFHRTPSVAASVIENRE